MKIKILTHRIRLNDGHVMPDWENVPNSDTMQKDADVIKTAIINGEYDTPNYAIRMRKYPTSKHLKTVKLQDSAKWGIC